jgi:hypothetical protein
MSKPKVWTVLEGRLYQSAKWHRTDLEDCRRRIAELGITGIACAWHEDARMRELVRWYRHWPMSNGKELPEEIVLHERADEIAAHVRAGGRVLTMCYGGLNRSGLLSALAAMRITGCTGRQAVKLVRAAIPHALSNEYFVEYIRSRAADIRFSERQDTTHAEHIVDALEAFVSAKARQPTTDSEWASPRDLNETREHLVEVLERALCSSPEW